MEGIHVQQPVRKQDRWAWLTTCAEGWYWAFIKITTESGGEESPVGTVEQLGHLSGQYKAVFFFFFQNKSTIDSTTLKKKPTYVH